MRINVEVEDDLMNKALRLTGMKTYRGALHEALTALVQLYEQGDVRGLRGKLHRQPGEPSERKRR